ncbi:DNA polymerase gamma, mitochondrial [Golovinomyces cichoracearum]|uniref:DNA-directed DNA polymerase n=1 Tax=Golovinomyces cichoracearum TaxID=62708 RepID=A0A420J4A4_9PEZI|nr:DNA polymerase gamma, mitochondrial [Golovinomyces cichoracearum]
MLLKCHVSNHASLTANKADFSRMCVNCLRLKKYQIYRQPMKRIAGRRSFATGASIPKGVSYEKQASLSKPSNARFNEIGVQQLSSHIYSQLFPKDVKPPSPELVKLSKDHLKRHDLLGKNTDNSPPISFDLPELQGASLDEHFYRLGMNAAEPFLSMAKKFATISVPTKPKSWVQRSGWTKYYSDGRSETVDAPNESMICFDTEVLWKQSPFAVMACAVSPTNWYSWLSPWLLGETENIRQLIPIGDPKQDRVIVGHNVGYDRARIAEEYDVQMSRNSFLDTMSLHVAVNGMCSRQRPTWMKHKKNRELREKIAGETDSAELAILLENSSLVEEEAEPWVSRSAVSSLRDVALFHLDVSLDKTQRNDFGELDRNGVVQKLDELLNYCAIDVDVTHRVYKSVFQNFLETCPHPVSFAALRHLSSVILPVDKSWEAYIANTEATYKKLSDGVQERLLALTEKALALKNDPKNWEQDPWLRQLDWSGQEIKMVKGKKKNDPPRPAAKQKMPGSPKWYKDLFSRSNGPISLTVRTRIAPLLLRLSWDGHPLVWSDKYGWSFRVPIAEAPKYAKKQMQECISFEGKDLALKDDVDATYFKLPHKDGPDARCANPMAKSYLSYFENGILSSEFTYAKEALDMNASCSYWISARDRIMSQMVIYESDGAKRPPDIESDIEVGYILPQVIPMGTITRRAVENTWLTASNAKKNRVGSELKSMVRAPPGYVFVGADVDSEELWIASLIGDAQFQLHGGNAVGFMTLEGTKAAGTDLHSRTASILGITRNNAKIFNYGRIYGAGLKFASTLLRQFNPCLSEDETNKVASNLYKATKGAKTTRKQLNKRPFWRGGTESFVFNTLEEFAEQERPRTPVLGAGITEALMGCYVSPGGFMTSRINWAIQSSGVDYLHLIIIAMDYLIQRFNLNARLAITVHDEIRYLVREEDKYRAAMALQVSNIWTRAMFSQQMGINDLPQSCAFFSAVDIDHVLRKEVDMDCLTPSHHTPIPHGESLDMATLLTKPSAHLDLSIDPNDPPNFSKYTYTARTPVMESLSREGPRINFLKAQISSSDSELREILKDIRKESEARSPQKEPNFSIKKNVFPYGSRADLIKEPLSVSQTSRISRMTLDQSNWSWQRSIGKPIVRPSYGSRPN